MEAAAAGPAAAEGEGAVAAAAAASPGSRWLDAHHLYCQLLGGCLRAVYLPLRLLCRIEANFKDAVRASQELVSLCSLNVFWLWRLGW